MDFGNHRRSLRGKDGKPNDGESHHRAQCGQDDGSETTSGGCGQFHECGKRSFRPRGLPEKLFADRVLGLETGQPESEKTQRSLEDDVNLPSVVRRLGLMIQFAKSVFPAHAITHELTAFFDLRE
jgi:hypothetical protein